MEGGDIEAKRKLLQKNDLSMKNIIKINSFGQINEKDMKLLRILFSQNP